MRKCWSSALAAAGLEPGWSFVTVDPSTPMLDLARAQIEAVGIRARVNFVYGDLSVVPPETTFDAALMIGVMHHILDDTGKGRSWVKSLCVCA